MNLRSDTAANGGRRWKLAAAGSAVALLLVAVVPPLRGVVGGALSRVILLVASPFTPAVRAVEELPQPTRVLATDGSEIGRIGGPGGGDRVRLDALPPHVTRAVLAAEDANFYRHAGVDPFAVVRAFFNNLFGGRVQGGSTITQQLAKLNYTGGERTFLRKFREVVFASKLERHYSKDELLEQYLNQVYLGHGAYGLAPASSAYFGVRPERLTPAQAATLAGKIRAPEELDPYSRPDAVETRRDQVLQNMGRHGWLRPDELQQALDTRLQVKPERPQLGGGGRAPHFTAYVAREAAALAQLGGSPEARGKRLHTGGFTIETTLDPKLLEAATTATRQVLGAPGDPTTAIVSVQPGDGAVRVLFGGLDPKLHFDVASQGRRQPGSSFKPYVYLAMLQAGLDPRSQFDSGSPKTLDCRGSPWTVRNFEGEGGGGSTVDNAMVHSINTVFAQIQTRVGPPATQKTAEQAGIPREAVSPAECAMALGGLRHGVSPLEQAAGFATFAARGVYAQPYGIVRIRHRDGTTIHEHRGRTRNAFRDVEVGVLNSALKGVVAQGTGRAAAIGRPLAGKTGTTENYGNAWFIGYVPQLSTAVWVGRPEGDIPMTNVHGVNVAGGTFPARIFSRYMRAALTNVPVRDLFTASPDALSLRAVNPAPTAPSSTTRPSTIPAVTTLPDLEPQPEPPVVFVPPPRTSPPLPTVPNPVVRPTTTARVPTTVTRTTRADSPG